MPDLDDFIDKVVGGQAGAAREQLQSMIGVKTADALDTRKQEISSALFNNGEEQELEEPEVEGDEVEECCVSKGRARRCHLHEREVAMKLMIELS